MSCHTGKGNNKLYNSFAGLPGNSSEQPDTGRGAWRDFFCSCGAIVAQCRQPSSVCVMRPLEVELEPQTVLCMRDAEMLLKKTSIIKVLHIFLERWLCAIGFLTRKSV